MPMPMPTRYVARAKAMPSVAMNAGTSSRVTTNERVSYSQVRFQNRNQAWLPLRRTTKDKGVRTLNTEAKQRCVHQLCLALADDGGSGGGDGGRGGGRPSLGGSGDEEDNTNFHGVNFETTNGLVYTIGALALSSAACMSLLKPEESVAADVPDSTDIPAFLKEVLSSFKGNFKRPKPLVATTAKPTFGDDVALTYSLLFGKGSSVAGIAFAYKSLLCWCTEDVELASLATDMGFLSFLGCFSMFAVNETFKNTRTFMIQAALSHIFLEMVFEYGLLRRFDKEAKPRITWDMLFHHVGSLAIGLYCIRVGGGTFSNGPFLAQGARLACTEITTGFPVAFKVALKSKRFKGKRRLFFAVGMPLAFIWRSCYTFNVLKTFLKTVDAHGGRKAIPSKWLGAGCFGSVVACNVFWTAKIFSGVFKTLTRKKGKPKQKKTDDEASSTEKEGTSNDK